MSRWIPESFVHARGDGPRGGREKAELTDENAPYAGTCAGSGAHSPLALSLSKSKCGRAQPLGWATQQNDRADGRGWRGDGDGAGPHTHMSLPALGVMAAWSRHPAPLIWEPLTSQPSRGMYMWPECPSSRGHRACLLSSGVSQATLSDGMLG